MMIFYERSQGGTGATIRGTTHLGHSRIGRVCCNGTNDARYHPEISHVIMQFIPVSDHCTEDRAR